MSSILLKLASGEQKIIADIIAQIMSGKTKEEIWFASFANLNYLKVLLEKFNANPNVQSKSGWTALMGASGNGHSEIVKLLLENKANPNVQSKSGWTALMGASKNGYSAIVKLLLEAKANPDAQDEYGWTALIWASEKGHSEIVKLLLEAKANPNVQSNAGWTALSLTKNPEIKNLLIRAGAKT